MVTVGVSGDHTFKFSECLLCKLDGNPVHQLVWDMIVCRKALHQMVVHPTSRLVKQVLRGSEFLAGSLLRAVQLGEKPPPVCTDLFLLADVGKDVFHAA